MNKQEFLAQLRCGLSGLPQEDIEERLVFYGEMIDDRMEEGVSETEAVSAIGEVSDVVSQILTETPLTRLVKEKIRPRRAPRPWEVLLIILGFPVWFPLLIAAFAVVLAIYIVVWSVIVSLWAVEVSLWAGVLCGIVSAAVFAVRGNGLTAVLMISVCLCCAGLSVFLFFGCKAATKGILRLTKKAGLWVKSMFVGKETVQ